MSTASVEMGVIGDGGFFRRVRENSQQLRHLLHRMGRRSRRSTRVAPDQWADLLAQLRDQLECHFGLEETCGYFYGPLAVNPNLAQQAAVLHAQHAGLQDEIRSLAEAAAARLHRSHLASGLPPDLAQRFAAFVQRFHDHEVRENDLLCQAYGLDLGVGD